MRPTTNPYRPFERFVFRSPLYPFSTFVRHLAEISASAESFKTFFADKVIQEAIYLASPVLFEELLKFLERGLPNKKEEEKLRYSLVRYLSRMSTRCTPFGLFAGCSVGQLGSHTDILLEENKCYKRHTRLDMSYLCALSQDLGKSPDVRSHLRYFCNTSAYKLANEIRYVEYFYRGTRRVHHLSAVDHSEYLARVMEEASQGKRINELAALLVDDEISIEDASEFVAELVDSQLIFSELEPTVTGQEFLTKAIRHLDQLSTLSGGNGKVSETFHILKKVEALLETVDRTALGYTFPYYGGIRTEIDRLQTAYEPKHLFQTDMVKPAITAVAGQSVITNIMEALEFLNKLSPKTGETNLSRFRDAFRARYEDREVPLLNVLDNETGIGYGQTNSAGDINPLVDDLVIPVLNNSTVNVAGNKVQSLLLKKYIEAATTNQYTIELDDRDFSFLTAQQWDDLPTTMSVMFVLLQDDENASEIYIKSVGGPSATNLLGRFCHADTQIEAHVLDITQKEEELNPDVIFAEIAHLPESRTGNILLRPVLRKYEIPYLAKSGVDRDYQIPLSDLLVSVRNQKIRLRSKRLDKDIVPRLGSAHNFRINAMPVYQFLCDMQMQDRRPGLAFSWGAFAGECSWLPRVKYRNVILAAARWTVRRDEIKNLMDERDDMLLIIAITAWRQKLRIPVYAVLDEGDNELFIDFSNMLSVRTLLSTVKKRSSFVLEEFLFNPETAPVKGPEGTFTNEFIMSFYNGNQKH
ncbi:lantibiotic dehydratase family protein [Sphingobacterium corticibacterium]|uniref:Lantibiotic dehydratase N-terminal domain-containing protein n=1 Tax=Sphingobacterium corticibacterium TaxID=2484746 RepID=A0A4Q6XK48_9SPHI|nr:lantibiotic dehydratase family protein [Sphingobacterium corticibacterium]RZF60233.1 hypothetical protein EWE74_14090 [Sphingobacterium corticibacterium]